MSFGVVRIKGKDGVSVWQRKHRWIGHVLRQDGLYMKLLHEIIEGRMLVKPSRGMKREFNCYMIR